MNTKQIISLSIDSIGRFLRKEETDGRIRALYERCDRTGFRWQVTNGTGDEIAAELRFIANSGGNPEDGEDDVVAVMIDYLPLISIQGRNFSLPAQYVQYWAQQVRKAESLGFLHLDPDTNEVMCRFAQTLTAPMSPDTIRRVHFEAMQVLTHERIERLEQLARGDISGCFAAKAEEAACDCCPSPPLDYIDAACELFRETMGARKARIFERLNVTNEYCRNEWQHVVRCSAGSAQPEMFRIDWAISSGGVVSLEIRRADARPTENLAAAACLFQRLTDRYVASWFGLDEKNCPCARMNMYLDGVPSETLFPMMEEMLVTMFHIEKERIDSVLYGVPDEEGEKAARHREFRQEMESALARFEARRRAEPFGIPAMRLEDHDFDTRMNEDPERGPESCDIDQLELFERKAAEEDAEDGLDF